jgi:hypothetical protein
LFNKTDSVTFSASLDVEFPAFVIVQDTGVGLGAKITYKDPDLLDQDIPNVTISPDALIEIARIQSAVEMLADSTTFLSRVEPLSTSIPGVKTTVNELIAGPDRTLADLFNLTGKQWT